ncbi:MAG: URC4/urg3 family protein [Cyanobacteria bacterium J06638_20]
MVLISNAAQNAIAYIQSPQAIRDRCSQLYSLAQQGKLNHFRLNVEQLAPTADYVLDVMRENYPDLNIPIHSRWRHFNAGAIDRVAEMDQALASLDPRDRTRAKVDLVIISVLLDAGAGTAWRYQEAATGKTFARSEGLAVASFRMFCEGHFSSNPSQPLRVDADALERLTEASLAKGFQVSKENPLVGLEGRLSLMQALGRSLRQHSNIFGTAPARPGNLVDYCLQQAEGNTFPAPLILQTILLGMGSIWPGRIEVSGVNLGDVWPHSALTGDQPADGGLVPFHKLSQWLTYSLMEPLQELGLTVSEVNQLTGLAEYRNGGLCLDMGLLELQDPAIARTPQLPGSEVIVEWRALTVSALDAIANEIRKTLGYTSTEFPLANVLEGGTWAAGRKIAKEKRPDGAPPLQIASDGTVF